MNKENPIIIESAHTLPELRLAGEQLGYSFAWYDAYLVWMWNESKDTLFRLTSPSVLEDYRTAIIAANAELVAVIPATVNDIK